MNDGKGIRESPCHFLLFYFMITAVLQDTTVLLDNSDRMFILP